MIKPMKPSPVMPQKGASMSKPTAMKASSAVPPKAAPKAAMPVVPATHEQRIQALEAQVRGVKPMVAKPSK